MNLKENLELLIKAYPQAKFNAKIMTVLYWTFVDGIRISPELASKIISDGTSYDSISRELRRIRMSDRNARHYSLDIKAEN